MKQTLIPTLAVLLLTACSSGGEQALGTLERDRIVLKATTSEIIVAEPVAEGTMVSTGTLLVQLDDTRQQAVVAGAKAEVARATARLAELRNGARAEDIAASRARLDGARASLVESEAGYQRARQLVSRKLTSQAVLDRALANRDAATAAVESAQEELLRLTNGTRQEQLDEADAVRQGAKAQWALEQHRLSELSVTATRDAYLDSLPWHVGERVPAGATVAIMLANARPYARVYVPESWRARLHVGDRLPVTVDGIARTLNGTLRWIATDPAFTPYFALNARDRGRLVYMAEFDLDEGDDLPTGVPAQVLLSND